MDVEKEISILEKELHGVPGTVLQRTLLPENVVGWTLGLGGMSEPKAFVTGRTVQECVEAAKKLISNRVGA